MRTYKIFEVVRQNKPDLLFPEDPVSKRWTIAAAFRTEQEARARAVDDYMFHYEVRERVYHFVRVDGFLRGRGGNLGKLIPVHDIEVKETISLRRV